MLAFWGAREALTGVVKRVEVEVTTQGRMANQITPTRISAAANAAALVRRSLGTIRKEEERPGCTELARDQPVLRFLPSGASKLLRVTIEDES
jgi:hypothetical protein